MVDLIRVALNLPVFGLVLCRSAGIVLAAPVFSNTSIPVRIKAALTVLLSLVLYPIAVRFRGDMPQVGLGYLPIIVTETGLGLIMGFAGAMVIGALHAAGDLMSQQIGLRLAQVTSPDTTLPMGAISGFLGIIGLLLFIAVDGHHWFIQSVAVSYREVPLGQVTWSPAVAGSMLAGFSSLFAHAIRIAAPLVGIMFLVSVMIALLAKSVPQMNILMVGYPVKVFLGLVCMALTLPFTLPVLRDAFRGLQLHLIQLMRSV